MSGFDFTPEQEDQLQRELDEAENRISAARTTVVTPQLSQNLANFYRQYPSADLGVLIPAARAYTDGKMTEEQAQTFLGNVVKDSVFQKIREYGQTIPKKKSWWERNVADKFKTGARYTIAGLQFVPEAVTNLASQSYQVGKSLDISDFDFDGFFISTTLGTLIANDEVAGEGYFLGGRAAELQAQRAREYRGTIDGQAFTLGRGLATVVAQPGSSEYRTLSGIVDTAAALFIPSAPGAGVVRGAVKATMTKTGLRTLAGLTEGASAGINVAKVADFFNSNSGRRVLSRMTEIKSIDESIEVFPTADLKFHSELVSISASKTLDATQKQDQMLRFVNDTLGAGDVTRGIGPKSIDDINISRWSDTKLKVSQTRSLPAALMAKMPGRHVIISGGNDYDLLQSVKNVQNYFKILRVDPQERARIIDKLTKALVDGGGDVKGAVDEIYSTIGDALKNMGVSDELNNALRSGIRAFKDAYDNDLYGFIDDQGKAYSFADMGAKFLDANGNLVDAPLATAGIQSEMLKHGLFLPDPRRVRRIANSETGVASLISWVGTKQGLLNPENFGDLRTPLVVVEALQNYVWRPLTLLTGGYVLRNMTDSLLRQSFNPNLRTGAFHPWELIQVAMHKRFKGDIEGVLFRGDPEELIRRGQQELVEATSGSLREGLDAGVRQARERATGVWRRVRIGDGVTEYRNGLAAEIALLHGDEVARKYAQGWSSQEIIDWMRTNPDGRLYLRKLQARWSNRTLNNSATGEKIVGTVNFVDETGQINIKNIETYISKYIAPRVEITTGGSGILKRAIGDGEVQLADGTVVNAFRVSRKGEQIIGYSDEFLDEAMKVVNDPTIKLKEYYKSQVYVGGPADAAGNALDRALQGYDRMVNLFFSELYPKREAFLNRSPAFRQFYYQSVDRFLDELAPGQAKRIVDNVKKAIEDSRKGTRKAKSAVTDADVARYIGDGKIAQRVIDRASGKIKTAGNLTVEQVSAYAKGFALDETKRLFYNAAERSNFSDVMRIIAPFGSAWYEVSKRWLGDMTRNPEILKRGAVTVQGLKNADPDGDGKGFFFRDPQTGEYMFNYPFSEQLAPFMLGAAGAVVGGVGFGAAGIPIGAAIGGGAGAVVQPKLEGINTVLSAPARSLSMGLTFIPGAGPFAQMVASKIIPDKPKYDFVRTILTPYGEPELTLKPSWFDKLWAAAFADPENDRIFGDTVIDTMRALSASGKYDLSRADERDRLENDAKSKARVLLAIRALGQFTGPTRPNIEFKVDTKQGDVYAGELAKIFRQYQTEDFDTAIPRFLDTFGEDVFLYVAGKTRATAGGLSASKEFGRWENENEGIFNSYSDVAGYFAPTGSNFDYRVYLRQIETGMLERLSPEELIKEAQSLVGRSVYRYIIRAVGPNPTEEQRSMLGVLRDELEAEFPGFAEEPLDVNKFKRQIAQLTEAANDPRLAGNPVADGLRLYLEARDEALKVVQARGGELLTGKAMNDLRGQLRQVGELIIQQFPEFERLYDRVLFNEIDLDVEVQGG